MGPSDRHGDAVNESVRDLQANYVDPLRRSHHRLEDSPASRAGFSLELQVPVRSGCSSNGDTDEKCVAMPTSRPIRYPPVVATGRVVVNNRDWESLHDEARDPVNGRTDQRHQISDERIDVIVAYGVGDCPPAVGLDRNEKDTRAGGVRSLAEGGSTSQSSRSDHSRNHRPPFPRVQPATPHQPERRL